MKIASVADVKAHFSEYLKESEKGAVVVTRNGRPVAVILGTEDEDEIERLILAYSPRFQAILEESRQQFCEGKGIPHDEFWRQVEAENAAAAKTDPAPPKAEKRSEPSKPDRAGPKKRATRKAGAKGS
jgi:prevent-host-death family protein